MLTGHERGMRRARQPLGQADNMFEAGFLSGHRKGDRALDHVRIERWTKIGTLDVLQRLSHALDIAHVGDGELGPLRLQPCTPVIFPAHQGADGIATFQQLANDDATCLSGCASHDNSWLVMVVSSSTAQSPHCYPTPTVFGICSDKFF